MLENIPLIAAAAGVLGLLIAFVLYNRVNSVEIDNEVVADITQEIQDGAMAFLKAEYRVCLLYTSPSPRDRTRSRMPSSA